MLRELFANSIWQDGPIRERRVIWTDAAKHRSSACFKARGVYLWGVHDRPLYVGRTTTSFAKRFKRYIWSNDSQCALAATIDPQHSQLPDELLGLLRNNRRLRVRIEGSARFAREGLADVWFALFPITDGRSIEAVEGVLIAAVNDWNRAKGIAPLLNVHRAGDSAPS